MATLVSSKRAQAVGRAEANAPFLRSAIAAFPAISDSFVQEGSQAAVDLALALTGESVGEQLRRQRHALALAVWRPRVAHLSHCADGSVRRLT